MKNSTKEKLQNLVIDWIDPGNNKRSANQLSKRIGLSNAYVSLIRNGKTEQISDEAWNRIAAFFNVTPDDHTWGHFETEQFTTITSVLNNAQMFQRRAAIDGDSGYGKSYAIKEYCRRKGNEEAAHIICRRSMNPRKFVQNIAEKVGLSKHLGNRFDMEEAIAKTLLKMDKPLLIFDELENLSLSCFSSIKAIIDLTDRHCGVVLSGIDIHQTIQISAIKGKDAFRQIRRRFPEPSYEFLPALAKKEIKNILTAVGIEDKHVHEWFLENIKDYDALENTVRDALRVARKNDYAIDRMFMEEVFGVKRKLQVA